MRLWAALLACLVLAPAARADGVPPPPPKPPPPLVMPEPPPPPLPPGPVLVPQPPPLRAPNLMDELKTERDLRAAERRLDALESRRRDLDAGGLRELGRARGTVFELRRR